MEKKINIEKLAEIIALSLRDLTKEELKELTQILSDKYDLKPTVNVVEVVAENIVEEQTSFNVKLIEVGAKKMGVIKVCKEFVSGSLMEVKAVVESFPVIIKENVSIEEANMIKTQIEEAGGTVTLE